MQKRHNLLALLPRWFSSSEARTLSHSMQITGAITKTGAPNSASNITIPLSNIQRSSTKALSFQELRLCLSRLGNAYYGTCGLLLLVIQQDSCTMHRTYSISCFYFHSYHLSIVPMEPLPLAAHHILLSVDALSHTWHVPIK